MFRLTDVSSMSSTLVETVSINYEDFSDSFLTCGTCLCMYDAIEHNPKLLTCSHTVCHACLERIIGVEGPDSTSFRCPICRETVSIPLGGVPAFPPSFIVNQLLDLMARQRRDVVPKCSSHAQSELLFCESCDTVFCMDCTGGSHNSRGASSHTVIPFSVAIKRMSEILLYKSGQCMKNLDAASQAVNEEINGLDVNAEVCMEAASKIFQDLLNMVEKRRHEIIQMVKRVRDEKTRLLREQLDIIEVEKAKLRNDCQGLQHQIEVRNITTKISRLNEKLDVSTTLLEPRENAFMLFDHQHNSSLATMASALDHFGRVRVSRTFPALCRAVIEPSVVVHLKSRVHIQTADYYGNVQTSGGDPVSVELKYEFGEVQHFNIIDNDDGTYDVEFTPKAAGLHRLFIKVFNRCIKDSPFLLNVTDHINPVLKVGKSGFGELEFKQPINVVVVGENLIFVLDTGNSRIKVLDGSGRFVKHLAETGLEQHSGTGMALTSARNLVLVNWRTKQVTEITTEGRLVRSFTSPDFVEPISVAANSIGEIIVADNGAGKLFVFDVNGKFIRTIGSKGEKCGQLKLVSYIFSDPKDELLVCDHRVQAFSRNGDFLFEFPRTEASSRGQYGGVTVDGMGNYLLTKSERGRCMVQVFNPARQWLYNIDSFADRLKRPSGLAVLDDGHVIVADLGNDCVKKFRYM